MKIRSKAALLLLALLAGVVLAPFLLRLDQVQSAVISRLQRELPFNLRLDVVSWHWWPLPYISARDLRIESDSWQLSAPAAEFHPSWSVILGWRKDAGTIVLKQPTVRLAEAGQRTAEKKIARLPHLALTVEDGSLFIPADILPFPIKTERLHVAGLDGRINLTPGEVTVRATATSPFCEGFEIQGNFRPATSAYQFQVESWGLEINKAIGSLAGGRILPARSIVDLKGKIK
ncbi:MAG: hypothetical protein P8Y63_11545, partial [Deltaproteobacteria bacterium]